MRRAIASFMHHDERRVLSTWMARVSARIKRLRTVYGSIAGLRNRWLRMGLNSWMSAQRLKRRLLRIVGTLAHRFERRALLLLSSHS